MAAAGSGNHGDDVPAQSFGYRLEVFIGRKDPGYSFIGRGPRRCHHNAVIIQYGKMSSLPQPFDNCRGPEITRPVALDRLNDLIYDT